MTREGRGGERHIPTGHRVEACDTSNYAISSFPGIGSLLGAYKKKNNDIVLLSHSPNWDSRSVGNHYQISTTQLQISTTVDRMVGGKLNNHKLDSSANH